MGENVGPRLTRAVSRARIDRALFERIGTKVTFIESGIAYELATDPDWRRILVGRWGHWVNAYTNATGPGGRLSYPWGLDISARRNVYAADVGGRILIARFDPGLRNLTGPSSLSSFLYRPVDVAWDGQANPLSNDFAYILDDSLTQVSYWDLNLGQNHLWSYGAAGSGVGQFSRPTGVCVGKTPGTTGGTQFTTSFYVVDRGNRRVVWLTRGSNGATWNYVVSLPGWDPTDCAVDHFGHVYVVDETNHRIHKFDAGLGPLDSYGSYGAGPNNLNTFAWPHAISVPCGLKVVNSQTVWYCEGRVLTAEQWSDSTGAVEHYLGIAASFMTAPETTSSTAFIAFQTTDVGYTTINVHRVGVGTARRLAYNQLYGAGGHGVYWDGKMDDGTPAPPDYYSFHVLILSAYGCSSGGSWCQPWLQSEAFYFKNCPSDEPPDPSAQAVPSPCDSNASSVSDSGDPIIATDSVPTTLFLRQRVLTTARPLARVTAWTTPAASSAPSSEPGSLSRLVREFGVRGLTFSVTSQVSSSNLTIRVHSMSGRAVRTLVNQRLAPGVYEVGWDGSDDRGRPVAPGVYIAVLSAGPHRAAQRLIIRQP